MKVQIIPCLKDNYSYLIIDEKSNSACVVDPSEAEPIIKYLENTQIKSKIQIFSEAKTSNYDDYRVKKNARLLMISVKLE